MNFNKYEQQLCTYTRKYTFVLEKKHRMIMF